MNSQQTPPSMLANHEQLSYARLHGRWMVLGRSTWIALVVLTLGIFLASFPVFLAQLHSFCVGAACSYWQLTLEQARVLSGVGWSLDDYAAFVIALTLTSGMLCLVLSTLIIWRRPDDRMALLVALLLVSFCTSTATDIISAARDSFWQVPNKGLISLWNALIVLVFSLFPSGQFAPRWTRWTLLVCFAGLVPYAFFSGNTLQHELGLLLLLGEQAILVVAQFYRYRRVSRPFEQQQTKWVAYCFMVPATVYVGGNVLAELFPVLGNAMSPVGAPYELALTAVGICLLFSFPLSLGVAILRYRLWDIDLVINRTLVYGTLTTSVIGLYILVVVTLGAVFQAQGNLLIALFATGVIAVVFQPLRERLQRAANRLMYGERDDPYAVLSRLGSRLEATLAPDAVLSTIVETVAGALKLPYAAITLKRDGTSSMAAAFGEAKPGLLRLPLLYHAEQMGELLLAPRGPSESFTAADQRLLLDLALQAGVAVHAVQLTADLQRSRERLVTAREEERRRLRRDLHDGLGPTLGALALKVGSARSLYPHYPAAAETLMDELETDIVAAVADIRRLVYALRPPVLDDLGLVAALGECAAQFQMQRGPGKPNALRASGTLRIMVEAPDRMLALPAAVEVAAYRIVQEALTNVARHAHAHTCSVRLQISDRLELDIIDDGIGLPQELRMGVGLTSMQERATELGGTFQIKTIPTGGTQVQAALPLLKGVCSDEEEHPTVEEECVL